MQRQDFWHSAEAEDLGAVPAGTKVGQFLFLSAQASIDPKSGQIVRDLVDLKQDVREKLATDHHLVNAYFGATMAQTWTIYHNISEILAKHGASLKDVIRQRIFMKDVKEAGWMERVMMTFYPDQKPVTLVMGVPDRGLHRDIRLWVDIIALIPEEGGLKKEVISLPELKRVTAPYPPAIKVGQYLFFDGITGVDGNTGQPVLTFDQVDPQARTELPGRYIDSVSEAMKAQFYLIYSSHIRRLLESQGAKLTDLLDVTGFWRRGMRDLGEREYLREKLFKTPKEAPPSTAFGVYNHSADPNIHIVTGGVALLPGQYKKEPYRYGQSDRAGTYAALVKGGSFWFHAGMIGIDLSKQKNLSSFADLEDEARALAPTYITDNQEILAKTWYIYRYMLDGKLAKAGDVVHQTIYLVNPSHYTSVERIAGIIFKGKLPPTTVIPIDEAAFYFRYHMPYEPQRDCEPMEIQLWGYSS